MKCGIFAPQLSDVCIEARTVEASEHLVELFAQKKPHHRHGKPLKFHWFAQHTTKHLGRLRVAQLAACDFQRGSDKLLGEQPSRGRRGGASYVASGGAMPLRIMAAVCWTNSKLSRRS